jgi:hypothetical protein
MHRMTEVCGNELGHLRKHRGNKAFISALPQP